MRLVRVIPALCVSFLFASFAFAAQRTFVSAATGSDANNCSRLAPCRNFPAAIALTQAGGEVIVLDSGGYGPVSITQSVQILAPSGVHAAITAFSGAAITVAAAGAMVRVKGLALTGLGGTYGISVTDAGHMYVENVTATGFSTLGFSATAGGMDLEVNDSAFFDNYSGFELTPATPATVAVARTRFVHNHQYGFLVGPFTSAVVTNSASIGNFFSGYECDGGASDMTIDSSLVAYHNTTGAAGIEASTGCTTLISNSTLIDNYYGIQNGGGTGTLLSRGNNTIEGGTAKIGVVGSFTAQ